MKLETKKMADKQQKCTKALEQSLAEQTRELTEKNKQLSSAYQAVQRVEARRKALSEITRDYLTHGDLEQSLELLVSSAAQYVGALAGRFFHCTVEKGETRATSFSEICWADPDVKNEYLQTQEALEEYAQSFIHSSGNLLTETLKNNQPMFLDAEQYRAKRTIPLPAGYPEIESLALIPVTIGEEIHGVISLANRPGDFDTSEEEGLEAFAAEAALLVHADSREIARSAAEETAQLRSIFLANMSHELRTPLNIIIGMNQLLQEMNPSTEQLNYLEKIGFSADQLLAMITDILDLANIAEGGKLPLKQVSFQPEKLFYSMTQVLAFRQANRKVELHADISPEIPSDLIGDSLRLAQILNNLLSNALKFTPEGSVILRVVPLKKTAEQVTLSFSIVDTGIGMTAEQIERVFQPFVQVDASSTREHGGSGLGLAISQQLCQLMGGDLSVESTPDQGSTFHFELPFKIDSTMSQEKASPQLDSHLQGSSVLIVNSCPACCTILPPMLETMGFKVDSVTSSNGALMMLDDATEQGKPYPFVLIGLLLDDMAGSQFVELLAEHDFPDMKKILLANPADSAKLSAQMATLGSTEVVSIPASPADLLKVIGIKYEITSGLQNSTPQPPSTHWQQIKVLLVDDNEMGRELGRALLQNVGIEVTEAENGLDAVDQVESGNFDLVLMDVQMPVLDGLSATRAIRTLEKKGIENLPIIAMTAHSFDEHRAESLAAGMNGHITKPIDLETLYAELQRWLPESKRPEFNESTAIVTSEHSDLEAALPGIDVNAGIHRAVGNRQFYIDLLKKYLDQYSATETELLQELERKQYDELTLRVHTLKGVAGNLGARHLHELAGEVEKQLSEKQEPLALEPMLVAHKQFLQLLKTLPQFNEPVAEMNKPTGSWDELQSILKQMIPPLNSLQAHGVKPLLIKIQEKIWPAEHRDLLSQLDTLVGQYQFNLASDIVRKLLQKGEN